MSSKSDVARAAVVLGAAIASESLRKQPHRERLKPLLSAARRAIKGRWKTQRDAALFVINHNTLKEAHFKRDALATLAMLAALDADVDDSTERLTRTVTRATRAGSAHGAELLGVTAAAISRVVASKSVKAALEGVDKVTASRIEEVINAGEDPATAVNDLFREMANGKEGSLSRLDSIAGVAVNGGYNAGIAAEATAIGDVERYWSLDGVGCPICEDNEAEGWIGPDETFPSGDEAPPAHPNCDCSLDVRRVT
jgi:hypothetical protein